MGNNHPFAIFEFQDWATLGFGLRPLTPPGIWRTFWLIQSDFGFLMPNYQPEPWLGHKFDRHFSRLTMISADTLIDFSQIRAILNAVNWQSTAIRYLSVRVFDFGYKGLT
jgi:hypothetical protein